MPAAPAPPRFRRLPARHLAALLALAVPVLAGLAYLAWFGAPGAYLAVNAGALVLGLGWIAFGRLPAAAAPRRALAVALVILLALPLLTGPALNGVARWIPLGPLALHSGMLALPLLAVLAADERAYGVPLLLAALFIALLQPDAASAFALTFACVGLHHVGRDWQWAWRRSSRSLPPSPRRCAASCPRSHSSSACW